jgi:hypothetical protein
MCDARNSDGIATVHPPHTMPRAAEPQLRGREGAGGDYAHVIRNGLNSSGQTVDEQPTSRDVRVMITRVSVDDPTAS